MWECVCVWGKKIVCVYLSTWRRIYPKFIHVCFWDHKNYWAKTINEREKKRSRECKHELPAYIYILQAIRRLSGVYVYFSVCLAVLYCNALFDNNSFFLQMHLSNCWYMCSGAPNLEPDICLVGADTQYAHFTSVDWKCQGSMATDHITWFPRVWKSFKNHCHHNTHTHTSTRQ